MLDVIKTGIDQTMDAGLKKHGLLVGRAREDKKAMDIIMTDTEEPQMAYLFGVW